MTDEPRSEPGDGALEHGETPTHGAGHDPAASVAHHDQGTHMDAHTALSDDDHGHAELPLGPIDWRAWAYALLGGAAGLVVVLLFWVAIA